MTAEDIAAFRETYGNKLPREAAYWNIIGDSTDMLERLDAIFKEKALLGINRQQQTEIRLLFIFRMMRVANQIACLERAGFDLEEIANNTPEELAKFIEQQIQNL